ncbi:MAG: UbiA family prenyltransferase [Candidatus Diapherotrites archaeon]|nr:UbiA family prenyltransferase [Candidatus Diapherotrites archaeon]
MSEKILVYLKLYRSDVAIISFLCYLIGVLFADELTTFDLLVAFLISAVSLNFVYCINSWADAEIDKINKPYRPIARGLIKPKEALCYCSLLLIISFIWPYLIFGFSWQAHLFLIFPIGGLLYSVKPFRIKRNHILSILFAAVLLTSPLSLGYLINEGSSINKPYLFSIFLYALAILPLKDIEDVKGDSAFGCKNWFEIFGRQKILIYSLTLLLFNLCTILFMPTTIAKDCVLLLIVGTLLIVAYFFFNKKFDIKVLYKRIISFIIVYVLIVFLSFFFS